MKPDVNPHVGAFLAMQAAHVSAVAAALETALSELGVKNIEGIPVSSWINLRRSQELRKQLILMEDIDPPSAAHLQQMIDGLRNVSGKAS